MLFEKKSFLQWLHVNVFFSYANFIHVIDFLYRKSFFAAETFLLCPVIVCSFHFVSD